jgi:hypothetical protein
VPEYKLGERANADVVTPVQLIVIDAERTEALRQAEARRVLPVFRHDPQAIDQAEAELRSTFADKRQKFLEALQTAYERPKLDADAVTESRFQRLVRAFQREHKPFPLPAALAETWAKGEPDDPLLKDWAGVVRAAMSRYLRPDNLSSESRSSSGQLRAYVQASPEPVPDLATIDRIGIDVARTNSASVGRARRELQAALTNQEPATAKFLGGLLRPNCFFEEELTRQSRVRRTDPMWAADRYEPGQVIVRAGDVVDAKARRALDQLKAKLEADQARVEVVQAQSKAQVVVAEMKQQVLLAQSQAESFHLRFRWLLLLSGVLGLFIAGLLWAVGRRRSHAALLPAPAPQLALPDGAPRKALPDGAAVGPAEGESLESTAAEHWKQRALHAEQRAERQANLVRNGLLPHLTRWFKSWFVQGLLSQRAQLVDTQECAERDLAQLEQRLAQLHAPLEERLRAYEQRIAELERDLALKGEENRELIKATIAIARKRLERERARDPLAWN